MADVAAGLLQARRCIHGVAEERDFRLDGAEFANDHGPAMKCGAEVCPEAEVANVGVGAFVQLLQRVEAGADAVWNWFGDARCRILPIDCSRPARLASKTTGEWRKRSRFLSRTTVIRVENGSGSLTPAVVKYSSGPSTMPISSPKGLYSLSSS